MSVVWKALGLVFLACAGLWFAVSIYGNVADGKPTAPGLPDISTASYSVKITTTGQTLLAEKYEILKAGDPQVFTLDGYYSLRGNKWRWNKSVLRLDEYYWGDIIIERRVR